MNSSTFAAWLFLLVACACFAETPSVDDDFQVFFRTFKEKRDKIGSLEAAFLQKTVLPDEILETEGVIYYSKPRRILFLTKNPDRAILVDGQRGYEYDAEIKQLTIFDIEDNPRADIFFLGFDDDTETLQKAYDVHLMITDDARGRQGIKIQPRPDPEETPYFVEVNLFLRDEDFFPYRIHIVNDAESQVFLEVQQIKTQKEQNLDKARIFIPPGVKIIENDSVIDTVTGEGRYVPSEQPAHSLEIRELPVENKK